MADNFLYPAERPLKFWWNYRQKLGEKIGENLHQQKRLRTLARCWGKQFQAIEKFAHFYLAKCLRKYCLNIVFAEF